MSIVKIQIPLEKSLRDKLEARADKLGFDSVQAYIRFWATAETDGRHVDFGEDEWGEPSVAAAKRLNQAAHEAKQGVNTSEAFDTVDDLMHDLRK
jgi:hypothetical protein